MNRLLIVLSLPLILFAATAGCLAQGASGPVTFQPGSDLQQRVLSPSPAASATKQSRQAAIGSGNTMIDTGDPKNSFWNEPVDLGGNGVVVNADMLWDASSKILYAFARTSLRCTHGKSTEADILVGIYGKKNFLSKSPGSGWWVVNLAQNQCQAPVAGLYGCKFDSQGAPLACGHAELDSRINDMAITEATRF
ncbi:MAG TPA: hypothetical protein VII23_03075 [Terriglobales bacterium]|jgi:hypothetical protein